MSRKNTLFLSLLFIAPLLFLSDSLLSSRTFFSRDLTYLFHPWRVCSSQMIQQGEMPLWNSYEMGGMPFLANCQSSILYPFTIFFSFFQFVTALKFFHFIHFALAGIGFYLFSHRIGFNTWNAFLGSIIFSYGGYLLTRLEFLSILGCVVWFPWILIFTVFTPPFSRRFMGILCAITLSFSLFSGFPQILILQLFSAILFSIFLYSFRNNLNFWFVAFILFLTLGAVQWLPALELYFQSVRSGGGIPFDEASSYSLPLHGLLGLVTPYLLPHHTDQYTAEKYFWIWSSWWGIVTTLFALFSCKYKHRKLLIFSFLLWFPGIVWSLGNQVPWFEYFFRFVPIVRLFRYPPVVLCCSMIGIAMLAMCGLDVIRSGNLSRPYKNSAIMLGGFLIICELWFYSRELLPTIIPDYFHVTSPVIHTTLNDHPGVIMLSPKMNHRRRMEGINLIDAQTKFRSFFFDLTNLPYRIKTIAPSGEPLTLRAYYDLYSKMTGMVSVNEARPLFNLWDVTHFLTSDTLDNSWTLLINYKDLKVYRNPEAWGQAYAFDKRSMERYPEKRLIVHPREITVENSKVNMSFEIAKESCLVFNVPFYPGWRYFCSSCDNHDNSALFSMYGYYSSTILPPGSHKLYLVYQPTTWKITLFLAIFSIGTLFVLGIKKLIACQELYFQPFNSSLQSI